MKPLSSWSGAAALPDLASELSQIASLWQKYLP